MTDIMKVGDTINAKEVMSSLEIAELTNKEHKNVMRDIRNLLDQGVAKLNFEPGTYKDANQQDRPCYNLTKKGCLILASGYDALLREKIINRWEELELEKREVMPKIPQTYSEALQLAADQAKELEEKNELLLEQQKNIQEMSVEMSNMKKKTDYLDIIIASKETVLVTQIAQDYGMSAKKFNKILESRKVQHKVGGQWILYTKYLSEGYVHSETTQFKHKDGTLGTSLLTKWTQKGRLFLYNLLKEDGILPVIEQ